MSMSLKETENSEITKTDSNIIWTRWLIMGYKKVVQYARYTCDPEILNYLDCKEVGLAKDFLKGLGEPLFQKWITMNEPHGDGSIGCDMAQSLLIPPAASDPLLKVTLRSLTNEFLDYLEKNYHAVIDYRNSEVLISTFEPISIRESFWEFLQTVYNDDFLERRWKFIQSAYRVKDYENIPLPPVLRDTIINEKLHLEVENQSGSFGDSIKSCMFCGRDSKTYIAKGGYVEFSSQKPQSKISTKNPYMCPICIFSVYVSPIRSSMPLMSKKVDLVTLGVNSDERSKFSHIFDRLFGISIGDSIAISSLGSYKKSYETTALTYLSSSRVPLSALADEDFRIANLTTGLDLDKKKILAIKAFEPVLGFKVLYRVRHDKSLESEYKKALWTILKGDYFSLIKHVGILIQNLISWKKEVTLDNGIYQLIKYEVIKMEERPDIVFGTALLIDAFLPASWKKENEKLKTEVRKVAYYLEKPEQVLYRLRQITKKDYATLRRDFANKAQFKLLKDFLTRIHEEEALGDFEEEQAQRKAYVEEVSTNTYNGSETLFLYHDDILKVYMYIQGLLAAEYKKPNELKRKYSEIINRIKYALIAKRPELLGGI
jgi:hypothetical protein